MLRYFAARLRSAIVIAVALLPASTLVVTLTHVSSLSKVDEFLSSACRRNAQPTVLKEFHRDTPQRESWLA